MNSTQPISQTRALTDLPILGLGLVLFLLFVVTKKGRGK